MVEFPSLSLKRPAWILAPRDLPAAAVLGLTFWATAVIGLQWAVIPGAGTALWPASGIAFAGLVLGGARFWPAVFLARWLAAITVGSPQPMWADLMIAAGTTLGAVLPAWRIRRRKDFDVRLGNLRDMSWLIIGGALFGAATSSGIGVTALWLSGTPDHRLPQIFMTWGLGYATGVLAFAPAILSWSRPEDRQLSPRAWAHLAVAVAVSGVAGWLIFLRPFDLALRAWHLYPAMVWAALAFSVRGTSLALLAAFVSVVASAGLGLGPLQEMTPDPQTRLIISQQFVATCALTILLLAAVLDERRGTERLAQSERRLRQETEALETLNLTGASIAAALDDDSLVQHVTDAGVALSGAQFGAFFYRVADDAGESFMLFALSGAPREAFERFGQPRNTAVFAPTFAGEGVVRSDDITRDPRYGHTSPHHGMPKGHLPVRSYLAAPVRSRSGEVIGGLIFGHPEAGVFTERTERLIVGIAAQAAISLDNARLYQAAQGEIAERRRAEEHQRLLINELNHRVKNTLATIQSITAQTLRGSLTPEAAKDVLTARLVALSRAHDVLTSESWGGADLRDIVLGGVRPFSSVGEAPFHIEGPAVRLEPKAALAIAMALHELVTNAAKYGALSQPAGRVGIRWEIIDSTKNNVLRLTWRETGGPPVSEPVSRGFGSRLIERGLAVDLDGGARLAFEPSGVVCTIETRLPMSTVLGETEPAETA